MTDPALETAAVREPATPLTCVSTPPPPGSLPLA